MLEKTFPALSDLPSVSRLLATEKARALSSSHGQTHVTALIRRELDGRRATLRAGSTVAIDADTILDAVAGQLAVLSEPSLRPVFNLTGTVLHTNLGRAFLADDVIAEVAAVARGASNLEYDLETGRRGDRDSHIETQITEITGAEAATVVNNNAAAVMLVLNSLALGREVAVSRGELVEIGGSFRIPDIMARSGCTLIEVGTTNRTHLKDFAGAIRPETAMIMKVHTSNYVIQGFTAEVPEQDLAALCRQNDIAFVNDLGSGTLANLEAFGLPHEPTPMDALGNGADVVTFSGDKLLGGPQAGIIAGRRDLIDRIKANPMKRALRCDKMTIAALSAVLRRYRDPARLAEHLPVLAALTREVDDIREMAQGIALALATAIGKIGDVAVVDCESEIGSGALPTRTLPSAGIAIRPRKSTGSTGTTLNTLATAFRRLPCPVIGRIQDDAFIFDLRCLPRRDATAFIEQLEQLDLTA